MSISRKRFAYTGINFLVSKEKSNLMSKLALLIAVLFFWAGMLPGRAFATPPKKVTLSYEAATKILKVTLLHASFTPSWHYIKTVTIAKNKQAAASYAYTSQSGDEFTYTYEIPAAPGDTFVVNAYCSMYGSRTESLTIPGTPVIPAAPEP